VVKISASDLVPFTRNLQSTEKCRVTFLRKKCSDDFLHIFQSESFKNIIFKYNSAQQRAVSRCFIIEFSRKWTILRVSRLIYSKVSGNFWCVMQAWSIIKCSTQKLFGPTFIFLHQSYQKVAIHSYIWVNCNFIVPLYSWT
jgi:hypothetical protein